MHWKIEKRNFRSEIMNYLYSFSSILHPPSFTSIKTPFFLLFKATTLSLRAKHTMSSVIIAGCLQMEHHQGAEEKDN